mgnify:CR=1 FL=1
MNTKTQLVLLSILGLAVLAGGYALGAKVEKAAAEEAYADLLSTKEKIYEEAEIVRNRSAGLADAVSELSDENTELLDLVSQLRSRPSDVRYVTVTETVVEAGEPVVESLDLPSEYVFKLREDLAVARFAYDSEAELPYTFETYDLTFRSSVVISEKNSAGLLQISSSADPETYVEVPIDSLEVRSVEDQDLFEPNIGMGITASIGDSTAVMGSAFVSFIHPNENIDVLGVRFAGTYPVDSATLGVDLAGYNLGNHLPVLTDFWLHAGGGIGVVGDSGDRSVQISLGTKF